MSETGALVEGLWNVPIGTRFTMQLSDKVKVIATARWCEEDRMGIEFATPIELKETGRSVTAALRAVDSGESSRLRKVG